MGKVSFSDLVPEEVQTLEDGKYKGQIDDITRDTETYDYVRYRVHVKEHDANLVLSFPSRVSFLQNGEPSSQHAKFLKSMGVELDTDTNLQDAIFSMVGKEIEFLVTQKETKNGTFSEIVKDSVKLVK